MNNHIHQLNTEQIMTAKRAGLFVLSPDCGDVSVQRCVSEYIKYKPS